MCAIEKNINKYELTCVLCECWRGIYHLVLNTVMNAEHTPNRKRNTTHNMTEAIKLWRMALTLTHTEHNIVQLFVNYGKSSPKNRTNNLCVCLKWNSSLFFGIHGKEVKIKENYYWPKMRKKKSYTPWQLRSEMRWVLCSWLNNKRTIILYVVRELLVTIATIQSISICKTHIQNQFRTKKAESIEAICSFFLNCIHYYSL